MSSFISCFTTFFISADIIFSQLFRTSFNVIWKRFLLQIFLFKGFRPNSLNSQYLLSVTKPFHQFSLKCLLKYFFKKFVHKILQKNLFCISRELLLYIYFKGSIYIFWCSFFNCYLAAPRPTLCHSQGVSLTNSMLITAF